MNEREEPLNGVASPPPLETQFHGTSPEACKNHGASVFLSAK